MIATMPMGAMSPREIAPRQQYSNGESCHRDFSSSDLFDVRPASRKGATQIVRVQAMCAKAMQKRVLGNFALAYAAIKNHREGNCLVGGVNGWSVLREFDTHVCALRIGRMIVARGFQ